MFLPLVAAVDVIIARGPERRRRLRAQLLALAVWSAVLAPWTIRNAILLGEFVPIEFESVTMREDPVILNGKTADLRYRAEFTNWSCTLMIRYNKNTYSPEQIINLFNTAGFGVGVGEWRVERNGSNGMFHVA